MPGLPSWLSWLLDAWYWTRDFLEVWGHFVIMAPLIGVAAYLMGDWRYLFIFAICEVTYFATDAKVRNNDPFHPLVSTRVGENAFFVLLGVTLVVFFNFDGLSPSTREGIGNWAYLLFLGFSLWKTSCFVHDVRRGTIRTIMERRGVEASWVGWLILVEGALPIFPAWFGSVVRAAIVNVP